MTRNIATIILVIIAYLAGIATYYIMDMQMTGEQVRSDIVRNNYSSTTTTQEQPTSTESQGVFGTEGVILESSGTSTISGESTIVVDLGEILKTSPKVENGKIIPVEPEDLEVFVIEE